MKIAIIGAGSMGEALASLLLSKSVIETDELLLLTRTDSRHARLEVQYAGVKVSVIPDEDFMPDVVVLSVKPQDFDSAMGSLGHWFALNPLVISMMTGISVERIEKKISFTGSTNKKIIRTMPNLPFMFGEGATGYFTHASVTKEDQALFKLLFEPTGFLVGVKKEEDLNTVTALSGSGPGYIAMLYRGLYEAAEELGLDREEAELLLRQTVRGFLMLLDQGLQAKEIERLVSSKGGTTEAAKEVLRKKKVVQILSDALIAAKNRAEELSK